MGVMMVQNMAMSTIKACAGRHINAQDVSEMYAESWLEAYIEDKEAVEKIVNLIR